MKKSRPVSPPIRERRHRQRKDSRIPVTEALKKRILAADTRDRIKEHDYDVLPPMDYEVHAGKNHSRP